MSTETKRVIRWIIWFCLTSTVVRDGYTNSPGLLGFIYSISVILTVCVNLYATIRLMIWLILTPDKSP